MPKIIVLMFFQIFNALSSSMPFSSAPTLNLYLIPCQKIYHKIWTLPFLIEIHLPNLTCQHLWLWSSPALDTTLSYQSNFLLFLVSLDAYIVFGASPISFMAQICSPEFNGPGRANGSDATSSSLVFSFAL